MSPQDDLRRRMAPRRSVATFSDDNDHNPLVLQDCPACSGSGKACHHSIDRSGETYALEVCSSCGGAGVTGDVEPYFRDDRPELPACADDTGWITCPGCDGRFALRDRRAWTGRRHLQCGQRIVNAAPMRPGYIP
jgi:DnaJ-class molecular chaperone